MRVAGEHGEDNAEEQKSDCCPGERDGESVPGVEGPRIKFGLAQEDAAEDGHAPGDVVAGNGEAEDCLAGGRGDEG